MYCRSRPQYRSDLGWILGVAFLGTLTRSARPAQGFTYVRCCSAPPASSPHGLTAPGRIVSRRPTCVQLPSACGCFQLAPQRTCTSNPGSMPGTPRLAFGPHLRWLTALTGHAVRPSFATKSSMVGYGCCRRERSSHCLRYFCAGRDSDPHGGLIQVAIGFAGGRGSFLTKRCGFLLKASLRVVWRAAWIASA